MALRILFDDVNNVIAPTLVLATRSGEKLGVINNVTTLRVSDALKVASEFQCDVHKVVNGIECSVWQRLTDLKLAWCAEWDKWFEIAVKLSEVDGEIVKHLTCTSLGEAELSQINLHGVEINTEADIERYDYVKPTVLFDEADAQVSLLNRILEKAPHYRIKHVDAQLAPLQRTFSFDSVQIYDAMQQISEEVGCLFIFDSSSDESGMIDRTVSVYDLEQHCEDCGYRGEFSGSCPECQSSNVQYGYGEDTMVFVTSDNLGQDIECTADVGAVKNCFRLEAGDDLMTATVANLNASGGEYLWFFSDATRGDMPEGLAIKLDEYDKLCGQYQTEQEVELTAAAKFNGVAEKYAGHADWIATVEEHPKGYNSLVSYSYLALDFTHYLRQGMMPSPALQTTSAEIEALKLTQASLQPVSISSLDIAQHPTADNAVLAMAKCIVDARYQVKVKNSTWEHPVWVGSFSLENYYDEEDVAESAEIQITLDDDYEGYVRQMLDKSTSKMDIDFDITSIFGQELGVFTETLTQYGLDQLMIFNDACQSCMDILIDQGISNKSSYDGADSDLYSEIYKPYYDKKVAIEAEIAVRTKELDAVQNLAEELQDLRSDIKDALDLRRFLGDDMWRVLCAYRREDTYSNANYISDGLSNSELLANAEQFLKAARKEQVRAATVQHSVTAKLKNLLVLRGFEQLAEHFSVGNWIRVEVDGEVYRLRLLRYETSYDDLKDLDVEFSDVLKIGSGTSDVQSILAAAKQMAQSYSYVARQAQSGADANEQIGDWIDNSLKLTNMQIVSGGDDQKMVLDKHGLCMREFLPITESYSPEQVRLINSGLYITDDNWQTSRAGIGRFKYTDPETGEEVESFGVIADTILGKLVLSEKVGIYTASGNIKLDEHGISIVTERDQSDIDQVFVIRRKEEDGTYTDLMYVDSNGGLCLSGSVSLGQKTAAGIADDVGALEDEIAQSLLDLADLEDRLVDGTLELSYVKPDDNSQVVSMINAAADVIQLLSNRLVVQSDNFTLDDKGNIEANNAKFSNGEFSGTVVAKHGEIGGLTLSGSVLSATFYQQWPEFTQEDLDKITAYKTEGAELTDEELEKYDVNMNGTIDAGDAVVIQQMIYGNTPNYTAGKITINSANPKEYIVVEVTDGYRAGERVCIGAGSLRSTKMYSNVVDAVTYAASGQSGYFGEVTVGDVTLTISGGIITNVVEA